MLNRGGIALALLVVVLSACNPTPTVSPTPTPVPTRTATESANANVEALTLVQAVLREFEFGFAPLVLHPETRIVIESKTDGQVARLVYPVQPANPNDWPAMDSFVLAYAVRSAVLNLPQVRWVALGSFDLSAPISGLGDEVNHVAAWVNFTDNSQAVVDLTPLATNFAARHVRKNLTMAPADMEEQFSVWRKGVFFDQLQPMKVVTQDGETYYLLAQVLVFQDRYEFLLQVHPVQTADPLTRLRLMQGTQASLVVNRVEFESVQALLAHDESDVLSQMPQFLNRKGDDDQTQNAILEDHLHLLWHLVTKLEHQPVESARVP
jgi:hypothetical protein